MLLYITPGEPQDREPRPLHSIPDTVTRLYLLGMREHAREGVLFVREGASWEPTPDWRFDRHVIRVALYAQERLRVGAGERVAVLGPLNPSWLLAEFATLGLGAVAVGLSPSLGDEELVAALRETSPRTAFVTDAPSAARLARLRGDHPSLQSALVPEGAKGPTAAFPGA
jgi:acyl-CoA synthetase (AMP-forming)/AMP-acid ligase II